MHTTRSRLGGIRELRALLAEHRAFAALLAESHGSQGVETHGQLAPGTKRVDVAASFIRHPVQWGACGLLATTSKTLRFHRTPSGLCVDPATTPTEHGNLLMDLKEITDGGRPIWGWPRSPRPSMCDFSAAGAVHSWRQRDGER